MKEMLKKGFRSVSVIGLGKNTGKTFTIKHLLQEGMQLGLQVAITSIGLDGEKRDSLTQATKPKLIISPGQILANAKTALLASGLDYEIIGSTGVMTPLGEIILARARSYGETLLVGPAARHELISIHKSLLQLGVDFLFVDGAVDRRSAAAPLATDTTVLAVGVETAWERHRLLEKVRHAYEILTLPPLQASKLRAEIKGLAKDVKIAFFSKGGLAGTLKEEEFFEKPALLAKLLQESKALYVQGVFGDDQLSQILGQLAVKGLTIFVSDPSKVFLKGDGSLQRIRLRVLDSIRLSAVTVNPLHSLYGYAHPHKLLRDVGQVVAPTPCFDLALGSRYLPTKEDFDAIF